ncbi:MAG: hypothetical protein IPI91_11565 [Flavobacteriales bacterium]|nr:hypothetical protein [Flavobacteriales bacterium]
MRRILTILILIGIVAAAGWTLYRWNGPLTSVKDPWSAIPAQAAVIVEVPNALSTWDQFTHTSQLWNAVEQVPGVAASGKLVAQLVAQLDADEAFSNSLKNVPVLIAILRDGGEQIGSLFILAPQTQDKGSVATIARILHADENALVSGTQLEVRPDTALPALSVRFANGLWMIASSSNVLDESEFQLNKNTSILSDSVLTRAIKTLGGGTDAHVLVHTGRLKSLMNTWWKPEVMEQFDLPVGWAALDLNSRPEALLLSGLFVPEIKHPALVALQNQGTQKITLSRVLPSAVNWMDAMQVKDPMRYLTDRWGNNVEESSTTTALFGWVNGTVTSARSATQKNTDEHWAVLQMSDPGLAQRSLVSLCADSCDTLAYRGVQITQLPVQDPYSKLLGSEYTFQQPWWMILGNAVILSDDVNSLRKSIDGWNDGNTLAEEPRAIAWLQQIGAEAGRTIWCDVARVAPLLSRGLRKGPSNTFATYDSLWTRFGGLSMQVSPGQHGMQHIALGVQHAPMEASGTRELWSATVCPLIQRKPTILINHTNNTREVFVQGTDNKIHLIGSTGKQLWSREVDGAIMGDVHQVDRFKNGKLQMLFNTAERIYLIDRNGKDVGGFPVPLTSNATAPLAVFDYDDKREYRILLPTANGKIMNFSMDGVPVSGWDPAKLNNPSREMIQHVRIKNKDYLVVVDGDGKVLLLDRRGEQRERASLALKNATNVLKILPGLDILTTRAIWRDSTGALFESQLNGTTEQLASGGNGQLSLGNLADDGHFDLIRVVADSLIVSHTGKPVFTKTFGAPLTMDPLCFAKGSTALIGVVIPSLDQVHLINDRGHPLDDMPLQGSLPITIEDLNRDGHNELITATADGVLMVYQLSLSNDRTK